MKKGDERGVSRTRSKNKLGPAPKVRGSEPGRAYDLSQSLGGRLEVRKADDKKYYAGEDMRGVADAKKCWQTMQTRNARKSLQKADEEKVVPEDRFVFFNPLSNTRWMH